MAAERLADVAGRMRASAALHCVVNGRPGKFFGLVKLGDLLDCTSPGNRILADLVAAIRPVTVRPDEPAWAVAELIERNRVYEVVVEEYSGEYAGLITAESVLDWLVSEHRAAKAAPARGTGHTKDARSFARPAHQSP